MKRATFAAIFLFAAGVAWAEDLPIDAPVGSVTVYQDRALIDRVAEVRIPSGEHRIVIEGLPAVIATDSVRATVPEGVTILDMRVDRVHGSEAPHEEVRVAEEAVRGIQEEIRRLEAEREDRGMERIFLESIQTATADRVGRELASGRFDAGGAGAALACVVGGLERLREAEAAGEVAMRDARDRLEAAKRRLQDLGRGRERLTHTVSVWVRTGGAEGTFKVSYLVARAGWTPRYDFRADADARSVTLSYLGEVRQETGEDWADVVLTLSTARPAQGASPAELQALFLHFPEPPPGPGRRMRVAGLADAESARESPWEFDAQKDGASGRYAPEPARPETRGTTVAFVIPRRETVASGEGAKRVTIAEEAVPTRNQHDVSPRVAPTAWLRSTVTNPFAFPMLSGQARVYFGPDYVGATAIEDVVKGDEFDLYLGADPQVKVERELVERTTTRHGIFSRTRRIAYRYRTVVHNLRDDAIEVILLDRQPVSRDQEAVVTRTVATPPLAEPADDDEKAEAEQGLLRWRFGVKPGERATQELGYTVEWPEDKPIHGLE